ncbi:MAG: hypothetical protein GXO26_07820 [Crenarchaeota archaeon]|nr:hypothetical protein [Thermoproteota archaeon]
MERDIIVVTIWPVGIIGVLLGILIYDYYKYYICNNAILMNNPVLVNWKFPSWYLLLVIAFLVLAEIFLILCSIVRNEAMIRGLSTVFGALGIFIVIYALIHMLIHIL